MNRIFRTYGRRYDRRKFKEVSGPSFWGPENKPSGGWWACPIETNEWYEQASKWSQEERDFWEIQIDAYTEFSVDENAILIIEEFEFLKEIIMKAERHGWNKVIDTFKSLGLSALLVTRECISEWNKEEFDLQKRRWRGLENTWEIESLFVFDPDCITSVEYHQEEIA